MTYRILVTTDFSPPSDYAVHYALAMLSRTSGAELHIAHVVLSSRTNIEQDERLFRDAQDRLRSFIEATQAGASGDGAVKRDVIHHVRLARDATAAIEQLALDVAADVVVVGTHQRRGIDRLVLGSVAEALLRRGRVPLLVARPSAFDGMERTPTPDAALPGARLHDASRDIADSTVRFSWTGSSKHIAGLL
jgi:nucleotide-binding universal stress UspA family protein